MMNRSVVGGSSWADRPEWTEEQLRFRVLQTVYALAGARCDRVVTGDTIGADLDLRYEDLFRVIHYLESNGFLSHIDAGPRVCITHRGIHYLGEVARRRRSIRSPDRASLGENRPAP